MNEEEKVIDIQVIGDDITVSPTAAHIPPNQTVVWRAGKGIRTFLLVFPQGAPFAKVELRSQLDGHERRVVEARVTKGDSGIFRYQVIALVDGDRLVADGGCPTVIVE